MNENNQMQVADEREVQDQDFDDRNHAEDQDGFRRPSPFFFNIDNMLTIRLSYPMANALGELVLECAEPDEKALLALAHKLQNARL